MSDWMVRPLSEANPVLFKIVDREGNQVVPFTWEDTTGPQKFCDAHNRALAAEQERYQRLYAERKENIRWIMHRQAATFADVIAAELAKMKEAK
jgi:hypothetical protein